MQYLAVARYLIAARPTFDHALLPARLEDVPPQPRSTPCCRWACSTTVAIPPNTCDALHAHLRPGGELVLETLIVADGSTEVLIPNGRYARMRNVWHIPARTTLERWIADAGFDAIRVVDVTPTTVAEQRTTPWMRVRVARRRARSARSDAHDRRSPGAGALRRASRESESGESALAAQTRRRLRSASAVRRASRSTVTLTGAPAMNASVIWCA